MSISIVIFSCDNIYNNLVHVQIFYTLKNNYIILVISNYLSTITFLKALFL